MVEEAHGESFLKHGVVPFISGAPWTVWGRDMSFPLHGITWGTRCRAFYGQVVKNRENPRIQAALKVGLPGVVTLSENTPPHVLEFLMNYHNSSDWQSGASFSFVELLGTCLDIEKDWKAKVQSSGMTVKSAGGTGAYERIYSEWLNERHPGKTSSFKQYESAKATNDCLYYVSACRFQEPAPERGGAFRGWLLKGGGSFRSWLLNECGWSYDDDEMMMMMMMMVI